MSQPDVHGTPDRALPAMRRRLTAGIRESWTVLRQTAVQWIEDGIPSRGAALSYYGLISLGPMMVVVVGLLQVFLTSEQARARVMRILENNFGPGAAEIGATVLRRVAVPDLLSPESLVTIGVLLFGATAVVSNIQSSLNTIWGVKPADHSKKEAALDLLRARARAFLLVLLTGLVIALSFLVTSSTRLVFDVLGGFEEHHVLVTLVDGGVSFVLTGLLFGLIYRTLPAVRVEWSTIWVGAFATALFFVLGKTLVAFMLTRASWTSYYGPAASIVTFLAWIYFSAQLFFLGAEFTQVWSRRRGGAI